jgi:hypothetical protein
VKRLEIMLAAAEKHERACAKVEDRFNLKALDKAVHEAFKLQQKIIRKVERVRSASPQDAIAKINIYRTDPEMFGLVFTNIMFDDTKRQLAAL